MHPPFAGVRDLAGQTFLAAQLHASAPNNKRGRGNLRRDAADRGAPRPGAASRPVGKNDSAEIAGRRRRPPSPACARRRNLKEFNHGAQWRRVCWSYGGPSALGVRTTSVP